MEKIVLAKDLPGSRAAETFLPASSKEAQKQFFQLVGLCEEVHGMEETETPVLTHEEALLMATALQHSTERGIPTLKLVTSSVQVRKLSAWKLSY